MATRRTSSPPRIGVRPVAVANAIRREKRLLHDQLRLNEEIERMMAADRARRERPREQARARREANRAQEQADLWVRRGYGARSSLSARKP